MIDDILEYNKKFVASKAYGPYATDKYPAKKLAILTCMDTRLTTLLPAALGLKNGDAKIIKNAGGVILDDYGTEIRSLLVAIYELGVEEIMVIHHTTCGACHMSAEELLLAMKKKGISDKAVAEAGEHVDLKSWLEGFHDPEKSVMATVARIKNHPLIPKDVAVRGFIIDSVTGELTEVDR